MNDLSDAYGDIVQMGWPAGALAGGDDAYLDSEWTCWTVLREGGLFHTRGHLLSYCQRLRETGRATGRDAVGATQAHRVGQTLIRFFGGIA